MHFPDMTNQPVPQVTFHTRQGDSWVDVTSDDLFKGKKVVLFALPGAFTPTCSSAHLPRYNELAGAFKQLGIDDILCLAVNDTFVLNAWKKDQDAANITFVPDGNGEFTEAMGRLIDHTELGFGQRSWRYSMLVDDGTIVKIFDENPDSDSDDPFDVSDADTMLKYLDPNWQERPSVSIFTKPGCPYCVQAKQMLIERGFDFEEIVLGRDASITSVRAMTGHMTAPQIFIGGQFIGGSEELAAYCNQ